MSLSRQRGCHKNLEFLFTEERRKRKNPTIDEDFTTALYFLDYWVVVAVV